MSIQTELDRIIGLVHESHEKARSKGGTAATPLLANLPGVIESIPQGVELPTLTNPGSASDLLSGKQLINADGNVVTGNIATKADSDLTASGATVTVPAGYYASQATKSVATATQATPIVSIDSAGKITASATQTAGYVDADTKTGTKQLTTHAEQTITPSTSDKTIASGIYLTGTQTIKGDANLVAGNIKSGVSIFGVAGSYEGGSSDGGDSVSEPTIVSGKTKISIPTSSAAATQTKVVTVKGLGFKPFCVMVRCRSTIEVKTEGKNFFISCQMASGVDPICLRALKITGNNYSSIYTGGKMVAYIEFIEDGFTLCNGSFTNMYYPSELEYIAIG